MARVSSFRGLLAVQRKRFATVPQSLGAATRRMALAVADDLDELTSGTVSSETLREMGHPFGRGPGAAKNFLKKGNVGMRGNTKPNLGRRRIPRMPINVQSGRLNRSIVFRQTRRGAFDVDIGRGVPYAQFVLHPAGTRLMVGRGVMGWRARNKAYPPGAVERRHRARQRIVRDALKAAHRSI